MNKSIEQQPFHLNFDRLTECKDSQLYELQGGYGLEEFHNIAKRNASKHCGGVIIKILNLIEHFHLILAF